MNYFENAHTVTKINEYIKNKMAMDENLQSVLVKGELSNFKNHYTGHMYFTLKDEKSLIKCVMFKSYAQRVDFKPKDGDQVAIVGSISVYERDGIYQIYAEAMIADGVGNLHAKFEELKLKLDKQGYYRDDLKKAIPKFPKEIGVLTAKTGSVVRDIINVATRRNPNVKIKIYPVPVQGKGAENEIAKALEYMNAKNEVDVIIIARGGGSLEDLWPFNEEVLANSIFKSNIPVISAVGHETDFTIADFVADLRAPTPSAAAELAVPDVLNLQGEIMTSKNRMKNALVKKIELMKLRYEKSMASMVFKEPYRRIHEKAMMLDEKVKRLENATKKSVDESKSRYIELITKLDALSPLKTLARGYGIAQKNNNILKSVKDVEKGDQISLRLEDGNLDAKII